jgi:hypothetical protein
MVDTWKSNHKQFCIAKVDRAPPQAAAPDTPDEADTIALKKAVVRVAIAAGEACTICLDPLTAA